MNDLLYRPLADITEPLPEEPNLTPLPNQMPDLETHRTLAAFLRQLLGDLAQVSTHLPETLAYSGRHLTSWSDSREDERWLTTAELVLGIREI